MARRLARAGRVLHIAVHSFTPVLDGKQRDADIGLLYDPARRAERAVCRRWQRILQSSVPALRTRLNYPYRGGTDGLTTAFRKRFGSRYLGVELEINQALFERSAPMRPRQLYASVVDSVVELLSITQVKLPR